MNSSQFKDWDVDVVYGGRPDTLQIKAPDKKSAEAYAQFLLKQRRKKPDTKVVVAKERLRRP